MEASSCKTPMEKMDVSCPMVLNPTAPIIIDYKPSTCVVSEPTKIPSEDPLIKAVFKQILKFFLHDKKDNASMERLTRNLIQDKLAAINRDTFTLGPLAVEVENGIITRDLYMNMLQRMIALSSSRFLNAALQMITVLSSKENCAVTKAILSQDFIHIKYPEMFAEESRIVVSTYYTVDGRQFPLEYVHEFFNNPTSREAKRSRYNIAWKQACKKCIVNVCDTF